MCAVESTSNSVPEVAAISLSSKLSPLTFPAEASVDLIWPPPELTATVGSAASSAMAPGGPDHPNSES